MPYGELPFGLRDCKLFTLTTEPATYATGVDFPRIRTVELGVTTDSTELEGDDTRQAVHVFAKRMEGSVEAGGINLDALAVLEGGVATLSGTGALEKKTYIVRSDQSEKYFKLEAQMYGDDGGDLHMIAYKAKATSGPNYEFTQGEFALLNCDVQAVFTAESPGKLYDLIQYKTVTAITP